MKSVPAELTTRYTSVIIRGTGCHFWKARRKSDALTAFISRFRPDDEEGSRRKAELSLARVSMIQSGCGRDHRQDVQCAGSKEKDPQDFLSADKTPKDV
jgi:hypothetical protein